MKPFERTPCHSSGGDAFAEVSSDNRQAVSRIWVLGWSWPFRASRGSWVAKVQDTHAQDSCQRKGLGLCLKLVQPE